MTGFAGGLPRDAAMFDFFRPKFPSLKLTGPRVYIRPPAAADQRAWLDLRRTSRDFLEPFEPAWPKDALTPAAYRRRMRRAHADWQASLGYAFFIFSRRDDSLLGGITVTNVRRGVIQAGNIGYWIGEPHKRNGYMFEAVQLCLDFCFRNLDLHRVEAACLVDNTPSKRLLEKSGFKGEGRARQYLCIAGKWQDHDTFAILRQDARPILPRSPT
ncbi:GNAT family N-acetyltransferase [Hwanghaeella sp.]|uniref:GNAT family N-acetyltransferase n=1 Tax=Hwanghaeella sp. TaxID=2605943 RepID=UPI003CCBD062